MSETCAKTINRFLRFQDTFVRYVVKNFLNSFFFCIMKEIYMKIIETCVHACSFVININFLTFMFLLEMLNSTRETQFIFTNRFSFFLLRWANADHTCFTISSKQKQKSARGGKKLCRAQSFNQKQKKTHWKECSKNKLNGIFFFRDTETTDARMSMKIAPFSSSNSLFIIKNNPSQCNLRKK